jgi:hypothetical protein
MNRPSSKERVYLHFEKPKLQEVFLQKLAQFSQGNNVVLAAVSNIDGFLWTDTCVSSPQKNRPIWNKVSLCSPSRSYVAKVFIFLSIVKSHKKCDTCCSFKHTWLSLRDKFVSSTQLNGPIWNNVNLSQPSKTCIAGK